MYDARTSGHFQTKNALWSNNHHLEKLDQMVCIVPAGVGRNLGAVVAVANQQGQNPDLFSYMRPQIHSVSCSDFCGESSCGGLASRLAFVYTSSPCEGDIANQRRLYIRGNHFGPAFPVLGRQLLQNSQKSQTKSRVCGLPDSAQRSQSSVWSLFCALYHLTKISERQHELLETAQV